MIQKWNRQMKCLSFKDITLPNCYVTCSLHDKSKINSSISIKFTDRVPFPLDCWSAM